MKNLKKSLLVLALVSMGSAQVQALSRATALCHLQDKSHDDVAPHLDWLVSHLGIDRGASAGPAKEVVELLRALFDVWVGGWAGVCGGGYPGQRAPWSLRCSPHHGVPGRRFGYPALASPRGAFRYPARAGRTHLGL